MKDASCKPEQVLTPDKEHYVIDNLQLVHMCLHKYIRPRPQEYEDCYQEGCLGLTLSAIRFDESLGYKFSTFAVPNIIGTIRRYLREVAPMVKYPRDMIDLYAKVQRLKLDRLDDEKVIKHLNIGSSMYFDILNMYSCDSLDREFIEDESLTLIDTIGCYDSFEEEEFESEFEESLQSVVKDLNVKYRAIYEEYIYSLYCGGEKLTQTYFAKKYNMCQAQVSRILKKLNKLYSTILSSNL